MHGISNFQISILNNYYKTVKYITMSYFKKGFKS